MPTSIPVWTRRWLAVTALCLAVVSLAPFNALLRTLGLDAPHVPDALTVPALGVACFTGWWALVTAETHAAHTREGTA